jgi:hypothetical protein
MLVVRSATGLVPPATPTAAEPTLATVEALGADEPTGGVAAEDAALAAIAAVPQPQPAPLAGGQQPATTPAAVRPTALLPRTGGSQGEPSSSVNLLSLGALVLGVGLLLVRRPSRGSR